MIQLRNYQVNLIDKVRASILAGNRKVLVVLPTGSGKTFVMADIAKRSVDNGHKILAMMHRRQLVTQMQDRFRDYELESGLIMAGHDHDLGSNIQIGTVQTYHRRLDLYDVDNPFFVDASVVFIDEAHRSLSKTFQKVLLRYPKKIVIGVTATPCLASGRGMGDYYDDLVEGPGIQELIDGGHLVPGRYYAPTAPDLNKLRTIAGDYEKRGLAEVMNTPKIVGDVFQNWARLAPGMQTIVFAVNVKHSRALCVEFQRNGVNAEQLDAHSSEERRTEVLHGLQFGNIQVVCNVGLYTEGFDYPGMGCIVIARPTKSMGLWRQMVGRGLRPYPDKEKCVIIDHGGCVDRLGFVEDPVFWQLDGKMIAYKKKNVRKKEKHIMTCDECCFQFTGDTCPNCGYKLVDYYKKVAALDAELVEIGKATKKKPTMEEKRAWFAMFEYHRRHKGYNRGWSAHKMKERFGTWPRGMDNITPAPPTVEFNNYMKYLMIKYMKSKQKQYAKR